MRTMTADTWGIAGPTFLEIFGVSAVVTWLITVLVRRALAQGRVDPRWEPGPEELGYVNGGARQAVTVSLAGLRAANAVAVNPDGTVAVIGSPPPAPSELTWAVYQAAQRQPMKPRLLIADRSLRPALTHLNDTLVRYGWLLSPRRRRGIRLAALPMFALVGLGIARIIAGSNAGKPVAYVLLLTALVAFFTAPMLAVPARSRAGQSAMARTRAAHIRLDPRGAAAASAFGVGGAALAVGLFGAAALWSADPALAAETDLGRMGTSSPGNDSGGSCGSSSSCSGGGGGGCGGGGGGCGG
jgi:uncharacterized protein (TIGR04222 family)